MKTVLRQRRAAFTLTELLVTIFVLIICFLSVLSLTATSGNKAKAQRISCANNLKEIGIAYRLWAEDNGNLIPSEQPVARGGWKDLLTNANQGTNCWTNYAIMANDLGQSPKLVLCPADDRTSAASWFSNATSASCPIAFNNAALSYFVGVSANAGAPRSILGGDRNLGSEEKPGADFGFSQEGGKGNDVAVPISGPVSWSLKIHSAGKTAGADNILLGDGSVEQLSSAKFYRSYLRNAPPTTNWPVGYVPATPSIRLVFP
jgi:type II secretory pathway pseudopilin PulG